MRNQDVASLFLLHEKSGLVSYQGLLALAPPAKTERVEGVMPTVPFSLCDSAFLVLAFPSAPPHSCPCGSCGTWGMVREQHSLAPTLSHGKVLRTGPAAQQVLNSPFLLTMRKYF